MINFLQIPGLTDALAVSDTTSVSKLQETVERLSTMPLSDLVDLLIRDSLKIGMNLIIAIIIYAVGRWLIKKIDRIVNAIFTQRKIEVSLASFLRSIIKAVLYIVLAIGIISQLGINTTSLVAIFASAGFAIGMALSGTLQNFAGGVMILLLRPFKVGDYIQTQGYDGTVKEIKLFSTIVNTIDNKMIIIPNGEISSSIINNYTAETTRRSDWTFTFSYGDDYNTIKSTILTILATDKRIMNDPAPFIALGNMGDSAIEIIVRAWVKSEDYWGVHFDINEKVYTTVTAREDLSFPFPQLDVHVSKID